MQRSTVRRRCTKGNSPCLKSKLGQLETENFQDSDAGVRTFLNSMSTCCLGGSSNPESNLGSYLEPNSLAGLVEPKTIENLSSGPSPHPIAAFGSGAGH